MAEQQAAVVTERKVPLYVRMARALGAYKRCIADKNAEWIGRWEDVLNRSVGMLPSGSGIDNGVQLDLQQSTPDKLILLFSFHHMNDAGMYDGWTDHRVIVTPSLEFGISLKITGRDRNIKEYLYEEFELALKQEVPEFDRD